MKKILGLDLGTNSIGWAYVHEAETEKETSSIVKMGVRVVPLTVDESKNFTEGKRITTNAERRQKRMMRRNLDRYQLRRNQLIQLFVEEGWIDSPEDLAWEGSLPLHEPYRIRAKAVHEKVSLRDLARIFLMINKKRGYKSNRKTKTAEEDGEVLDDMQLALYLREKNMTPGQYAYELLLDGKRSIPKFYRSDLQEEFSRIWKFQQPFYSNELTDELLEKLQGVTKQAAVGIWKKALGTETIKLTGKDKKIEAYRYRAEALKKKLPPDQLGLVLTNIIGEINGSSGYLGAISDRSKLLHVEKLTVGEFQYRQLQQSPHNRLKNQIFYRQDYLNEFDKIWDTQQKFYPKKLRPELRKRIRDRIIFYQRPLKSQKGLISFCTFESKEIEKRVGGKTKKVRIGSRVAPRSSPLFQEFKIWQRLHDVQITNIQTGERFSLSQEWKEKLFEELNTVEKWKAERVLKEIYGARESKNYVLNFKELQGNATQAAFYKIYQKMMEEDGRTAKLANAKTADKKKLLRKFFAEYGIDSEILEFDAEKDGKSFTQQKFYRLWHLLYSYESDNSRSGIDSLLQHLEENFGFPRHFGRMLANISLLDDYASLSTKALRKIYPYIKESSYTEACEQAGYRHALHLTKEENQRRELLDRLELLPKNSLRNPVVEKILNQMIHLVNGILEHPEMGRPDEIRIELARELKSSAKEREKATREISKATKRHEEIRKKLQEGPFNIINPTRNDIIRYKLWEELSTFGYKTLYSGCYISPQELFSKNIDIEHIIPKAKLYDDSFSNKTLALSRVNKEKGDNTAMTYMETKGADAVEQYKKRVRDLYQQGVISKAKYFKLLKTNEQLEEQTGFIARDIRETQYITKKAKELLEKLVRKVVPTTGKITDRLREDWGLIDVLKEINLPKYRALGLTKVVENRHGQKKEIILNWTKRNDHRHHAMDALVVAFTTHNHINYLNQVHAKTQKTSQSYALKNLLTFKDRGKEKFKAPMPNLRAEARKQLEAILVSYKAKNKVTVRSVNKIKVGGGSKTQKIQVPRGQLHKETIYGSQLRYQTKEEKIGKNFTKEKIATVAKKQYRDLLMQRLEAFGGNPVKAFTGKNALSKNPIYLPNGKPMPDRVKTVTLERQFTIRKEIGADLRVDKVIDQGIRKLLEQRLEAYGGKAKEAFANLEENPIWLDKERGIAVKRVKIRGVENAIPLHVARDHFGNPLFDEDGEFLATDYVQTGNNHHVAIYQSPDGKLHEQVVSFFEAVRRKLHDLPVVDRSYKKEQGWKFLFTLKQNEFFVFPDEKSGFDPSEIDLLNPTHAASISPHLFRVQKIASKNYLFTHHLETESTTGDHLKNFKNLIGVKYMFVWNPDKLEHLVKVRLNHLGEIVAVGEY